MPVNTGEKQRKPGQFCPGQSGIPAGPPKRSRNTPETAFVDARVEAFNQGDAEVIRKVHDTDRSPFSPYSHQLRFSQGCPMRLNRPTLYLTFGRYQTEALSSKKRGHIKMLSPVLQPRYD